MKSKTALKAKKPLRAKQTLKGGGKKKKRTRVPLEEKTRAQLVKVADEWFSKLVRVRDCELDDEGNRVGKCITCSKSGVVVRANATPRSGWERDWDAGHFVSRGYFICRWEEENVNLQCSFRCNRLNSGEYQKYKSELRSKYGDGVPERLEELAEKYGKANPFTKQEILQMIADFKEQLNFYLT